MLRPPPRSTLFPYKTLFRSLEANDIAWAAVSDPAERRALVIQVLKQVPVLWVWDNVEPVTGLDRKSTRLNSSHMSISYAVFCLKKKNHPSYDRRAPLCAHTP